MNGPPSRGIKKATLLLCLLLDVLGSKSFEDGHRATALWANPKGW